MRGLAIPQGNQEPLVVKTRMDDPRWAWRSMSMECDLDFWPSRYQNTRPGRMLCRGLYHSLICCWLISST